MVQFNMQVDDLWQKNLHALQKNLGFTSKAHAVRWAVEQALKIQVKQPRSKHWWQAYGRACTEIPRHADAALMTENQFYKNLF